ncbi:hypothetical protein YPPY06_0598 [Yersinia pestis PY-06]|nr:hypothetical protein YPPY06_0598 [Yersinia pestis PY-06]
MMPTQMIMIIITNIIYHSLALCTMSLSARSRHMHHFAPLNDIMMTG